MNAEVNGETALSVALETQKTARSKDEKERNEKVITVLHAAGATEALFP